MNQKPPLRNEVELSPKRFLAESSTKGLSAQDLRPKFQPIYQETYRLTLIPHVPAPRPMAPAEERGAYEAASEQKPPRA